MEMLAVWVNLLGQRLLVLVRCVATRGNITEKSQCASANGKRPWTIQMTVNLIFFGATADAVGKREIELDLADGATVDDALDQLKQSNSGLGKHKLLIALNEEYVSLDMTVRDGDTLAIFTAVSGG